MSPIFSLASLYTLIPITFDVRHSSRWLVEAVVAVGDVDVGLLVCAEAAVVINAALTKATAAIDLEIIVSSTS